MLTLLVVRIHIRPGAHNRALIRSKLALSAHGDSVLGAFCLRGRSGCVSGSGFTWLVPPGFPGFGEFGQTSKGRYLP